MGVRTRAARLLERLFESALKGCLLAKIPVSECVQKGCLLASTAIYVCEEVFPACLNGRLNVRTSACFWGFVLQWQAAIGECMRGKNYMLVEECMYLRMQCCVYFQVYVIYVRTCVCFWLCVYTCIKPYQYEYLLVFPTRSPPNTQTNASEHLARRVLICVGREGSDGRAKACRGRCQGGRSP